MKGIEVRDLDFTKWHGTGNDFILVDDREGGFPKSDLDLVRLLCDRHFGIGSDGLILLQRSGVDGVSFHMEFFNPDGSKSFCGNGSRCAFAFWRALTGEDKARFSAIDGFHDGRWVDRRVSVSLTFEGQVERAVDGPDVDHLNNGSPHELVWVMDPASVDVALEGRERRHAARYAPEGTNVNFVRVRSGAITMRTFERGVEAETLSCGTGVVAAALSALDREMVTSPVPVHTMGGDLSVLAERLPDGTFRNIHLIGPATEVFSGTFVIR
ncbi:MAG: diaminopimelate epimerase [Flavobacteriales bacterium]|nr:diaminopimelate epimerase [Flavobacteriales bacterium]